MQFSSSMLGVAIAAICLAPSAILANDTPLAARLTARRELEFAKAELRYYWQVEYPRQRRHINAQIQLTEAEIKAYKERLCAYDPFDRFSYGEPFMVTLQELKMCIRDAELRLRDLWAERDALIRFHPAELRVLERNAYEARLRVAELEADAEVAGPEPLALQQSK